MMIINRYVLPAFILLSIAGQAFAQKTDKMETSVLSGKAPINGIDMYYEIHGKGDVPIVLIHGGGSTIHSSFGMLLPLLAVHHQVIAVELQAHGRTGDRNAPESFEQDADDVAELLRYLKVDKANVVGFSNGGTTTLQIAIRHPEVVNKMVVMSGAYKRDGFTEGFFDFMEAATFESMPQPLKDAYLNVTPDQAGLVNMFNKDKQRMIHFQDISDEAVRSIKAPALFMVADKDVITVEHTIALSKIVHGSDLIVLPGTHGQFFGEVASANDSSEMPQATALLIEAFLKKEH